MTTIMLCALCLFVGFMGGVVAQDGIDLLRTARKERKAMNTPRTSAGTLTLRTLCILVGLALAANVTVGVTLVISRASFTHYSTCTAQWQQDWASAYKARYHSAVRVGNAMDGVIYAVKAQDADKFHHAIRNYTTLRDKQDLARASHPLPPLPNRVCGER